MGMAEMMVLSDRNPLTKMLDVYVGKVGNVLEEMKYQQRSGHDAEDPFWLI